MGKFLKKWLASVKTLHFPRNFQNEDLSLLILLPLQMIIYSIRAEMTAFLVYSEMTNQSLENYKTDWKKR